EPAASPGARASAHCAAGASSFLVEVSLRALYAGDAAGDATGDAAGAFGVALSKNGERALQFTIEPGTNEARLSLPAAGGEHAEEKRFALPADFDARALHLVRAEVDDHFATIFLDERVVRWQGTLNVAPNRVALVTEGTPAAFKGFELTDGWEELFMQPERSLAERGWRQAGEAWQLEDNLLRSVGAEGRDRIITRAPSLESYELVVNVRLEREPSGAVGCYGFRPTHGAKDFDPLFTVERDAAGDGWRLAARNCENDSLENGSIVESWPLPASFDPYVMQQFRFRKQHGRLAIGWEATPLGDTDADAEATGVGLYADRVSVAFDMVRVTALRTVTSDE
ncbi:MAG TPA: hypothetical protein VIQ24_18920, partial [Pyrinomonadaceae bacterium]